MEKTYNNLLKSKKNNQALKFVIILIGIGIISIIVYSMKNLWSISLEPDPITKIIKTITSPAKFNQLVIFCFSVGLLIAGSAITIGCLVGFIFAIPKQIKNSDNNFIKAGQGYISNDNLVEASDWLTKIIVGVSLTQLTSIPRYLHLLGKYVGIPLGGDVTGEVAAESIVIYFLICGFLLSYLWTRLYFARMLEESDNVEPPEHVEPVPLQYLI